MGGQAKTDMSGVSGGLEVIEDLKQVWPENSEMSRETWSQKSGRRKLKEAPLLPDG